MPAHDPLGEDIQDEPTIDEPRPSAAVDIRDPRPAGPHSDPQTLLAQDSVDPVVLPQPPILGP